jgi:hypothetical protein
MERGEMKKVYEGEVETVDDRFSGETGVSYTVPLQHVSVDSGNDTIDFFMNQRMELAPGTRVRVTVETIDEGELVPEDCSCYIISGDEPSCPVHGY